MIEIEGWRTRGRRYVHRGHPIFYVEEGSGPVLLLIHGFPTASWDWTPIWAGLIARFRVIAPDLIGFGFSAKPRPVRVQRSWIRPTSAQACWRTGVCTKRTCWRTTTATRWPRSYWREQRGARAACALRSVCFLNGGLFPETHRPRLIQRLLIGPLGPLVARLLNRSSFGRSFSAVFGPQTRPAPEDLDAFWRLVVENDGLRVMHRLIRYMKERRTHRERWVGALQRARVPLRVIDGAVDPVSGAHMVKRYRELVPDADVVLLPDVGHYPQVEAPAAVLAAYLTFADARRP